LNSDKSQTPIQHVTDTAVWVAYYRDLESRRPDALFQDPYAKHMMGERGETIARFMNKTTHYTAWTLAIRTVVIDRFILEKISEGVDTILNLGAGLDARPYRLDLPSGLKWIEVDFDRMISHKSQILAGEKPRCTLERVSLDLSSREERKELFARINSESKKVLVITEGVIPYLTENQVAELATDLHAQPHFQSWIGEYFSPQIYRYLDNKKRRQTMRHAPFQFFPKEWFPFFARYGWVPAKVEYLAEVSAQLGRKIPGPWWAFIFRFLGEKIRKKAIRSYTGYVIFEKSK